MLHFALRPRECFLAAGERMGAVELARAVDGALPGSSEGAHTWEERLINYDHGVQVGMVSWYHKPPSLVSAAQMGTSTLRTALTTAMRQTSGTSQVCWCFKRWGL